MTFIERKGDSMNYYLCVDIGGTACKAGILNEKGEIIEKLEQSVNFDAYKTPVIETVVKTIKTLMAKSSYRINGIAVSATGQIDTSHGKVVGTCGNIKNYVGSNFKERFENEFKLTTTVINDANCMILGEKWQGNAKEDKNIVGITLGTGVGGGIIVDGKILLGSRGIAGELGHMILNNKAKVCTCGNLGCYETLAATSYLCKMVKDRLNVDLNGLEIFNEVKNNHKEIIEIVDEWMDNIVDGIVSLVHIFNPSKVLIGGGISAQEELLIKPIKNRVLEKIMPAFVDGLIIEAALLKNDAGMVGALYFHLSERGLL